MDAERDELAELIRRIDGPATLGGLEVADAIIAAGYRKFPTITTLAQLEALPAGTSIMTSTGLIYQKTGQPGARYQWRSIEGHDATTERIATQGPHIILTPRRTR
ncbi:MAG: hypothetical protein ACTHJM_15875 [Marmoricola sp.]